MQSTPFFQNETGAVTVDWVVLTAALVGLGLAVATTVGGGVEDISTDIADQLTSPHIKTSFGLPPSGPIAHYWGEPGDEAVDGATFCAQMDIPSGITCGTSAYMGNHEFELEDGSSIFRYDVAFYDEDVSTVNAGSTPSSDSWSFWSTEANWDPDTIVGAPINADDYP